MLAEAVVARAAVVAVAACSEVGRVRRFAAVVAVHGFGLVEVRSAALAFARSSGLAVHR